MIKNKDPKTGKALGLFMGKTTMQSKFVYCGDVTCLHINAGDITLSQMNLETIITTFEASLFAAL